MSAAADEACRIAISLARNAGYAVFPCRADKSPACPHGFRDASRDPAAILRLWHRWPGELIGVATGAASGVSVLDIDQKHPEAVAWWQDSHLLLLPTRTLRTRSGGLHLYFRHQEGVRNTQGKIAPGVDSRGQGGYVISWFATGLECLDHAPPAPWPVWLLAELTSRPEPQPQIVRAGDPGRAIDGILRRLVAAQEGERNGMLFWAACRLAEHGMQRREIEALLIPIAISAGLTEIEARRTIGSANGKAAA